MKPTAQLVTSDLSLPAARSIARWLLLTLLSSSAACDGPDDVPDAATRRDFRPTTCTDPWAIPLRGSDGSIRCETVGALIAPVPPGRAWADATLTPWGPFREPVKHVAVGAAGGDGSASRPFGSVSEALAALGAGGGTILAGPGAHRVAALSVSGDVAIVGVGAHPAGTSLLLSGALTAGGADAVLRIAAARLRADGASVDGVVAAPGARALLADVVMEGVRNGVTATGARVEADGLTVLGSRSNGVALTAGSHARLTRFVVRDGLNQGIFADTSRVLLSRGLIMENGRHGLSLVGAPSADSGAMACEGTGVAVPGPLDCLSEVSITCNGIAGLYVEGARQVEGRRIASSGTRAVPGTSGGDGVYVGPSANLRVDRELTSPEARGTGSELVGNARAGVLVQGAGASLELRGALVGSNEGPGVYVADRATASAIGACIVGDNGSLGIGATPSTTLGEVSANNISDTRLVSLVTDRGALMLGDGISVSSAVGARPRIVTNELSRNSRFAAILVDSPAEVRGNTGEGNRYPVTGYNASLEGFDPSAVRGLEAAPETPQPRAQGMFTLTGAMLR